ncbi:DNA cytosine methyltransferase [Erwinia sp. Leaf53]|uniref:DNA cytosine methyltransferase n=1 Tax=Erwinia sp. Leaf53 TaxID=1736225 RepID=UPI0006F3B32B|nr:DNA cytosine methyltransferase [Erwinia sp. Leaf53]KQN53163.1 DNA methyltransferase [Erwinia sp. Leaf53]
MREIIVDNFAGGGGASTGIEAAIGRSVDIAINHDPNAIAMHSTNHPETLHYCESVFDINPVTATAGAPVALAWFSPDCRHFSKAKGSTPVKKEIRGLAWIVLRWALATRPRVIKLENVEEFKGWGPLIEFPPKPDLPEGLITNFIGPVYPGYSRPDPARFSETFTAFVGMLSTGVPVDHPALDEACHFLQIDRNGPEAQRLTAGLGYTVEHRELRACDYGAPTIRKRFFMVMRCDGRPVVWPDATHGDPKSLAVQSGQLKPWRTAAECIDWEIPCPSIFGRKKSLAENTMRRIARGIQRFVIDNPTPFIVKCNHTSNRTKYECFRGQSLYDPLHTITKTHGFAVASPVIAPVFAGTGGSAFQMKPRPVDKPFFTLMTQNRTNVICPLLAPLVARQFGSSIGHAVDQPSGTITAGGGGKSQLVSPTLIQMGYGERLGQAPRVLDIHKPVGTVTAGGNKFAIASAFLAKHFGGNYTGPGAPLDGPAHTVTTTDHHALVTAQIIGCGGRAGQSRPRDASEPLQTVTAKADSAVVTSHLVKLRGTCKDGQRTDQPMPTITAGGQHVGEVRTCLAVHDYDEERAALAAEFLHQHGMSEFVQVEGVTYRIVDIGMRMLQPKELYAAQGFPSWYVIDRDYRGNTYSKDKQVARCGNAVPPQFAEALVRANLPELCMKKLTAA